MNSVPEGLPNCFESRNFRANIAQQAMKLSKVLSAENAEGAEKQDNILFPTRRTYFSLLIISLRSPRSLRSLLKC